MWDDDEVLDDMDGLKDPPPKPPKEKKETDDNQSNVLSAVVIVLGLFLLGMMGGGKSSRSELDMDRINRIVNSTREQTKQLEGILENVKATERSIEWSKTMDSLRNSRLHPSVLERKIDSILNAKNYEGR